jgi:hypothetical protein
MGGIGIPFDSFENDSALNYQFSENEYDSKYFLKNSGSSFHLLMIYISLWGILLFLSLLSNCSNRMRPIKLNLQKQLKWKQSFNYLLSQSLPLFLCSLLNMQDLRFTGKENLPKISSYISVGLLIAFTTILALIFLKV